jgi:hypothetical protein
MSTETGYSLKPSQITQEMSILHPSEARSTPQIPLPAVPAPARQGLKCPNCQHPYLPGELVCNECGTMFSAGGKTHQLGAASSNDLYTFADLPIEADTKPICVEIDGQQVTLPTLSSFTIGRVSPVPGDIRPDVGLNQSNAEEKGVSRQHVRIMRKRGLVYIADLDSSNGTFLNGRRLTRNCYRMLTSGDELELGSLKVKVQF